MHRRLRVFQRTRKDVEKFATKTMSWTSGIQGSKCRSESAREGMSPWFICFSWGAEYGTGLEIRHKGSNTLHLESGCGWRKDEARPLVSAGALCSHLCFGWQEGHHSHKKPHSANPRRSLPEHMEEENSRGNQFSPADPGSPEKWSLSGSFSNSSSSSSCRWRARSLPSSPVVISLPLTSFLPSHQKATCSRNQL